MTSPATSAESWAAAVDLGARGRYAEAEAPLVGLAPARDRWASLALSTLASHRRQVGDVEGAGGLDSEALATASDAESRAEALVGLAADAIAGGDAEQALARHVEAATDAAPHWRTLTRWHWVGAERALLVGDPARATDHARRALAACLSQSVRHEAKSRMILAVASGRADDLPDVSPVLLTGGWVTLAWPLALVARDHAEQLPPAWLAEAWESGREATHAIERGLPKALVPAWRAHPGVRRLRADGPPARGE